MNENSFIKFLIPVLITILYSYTIEKQTNVYDNSKLNIIVIDAGHGGKDYSATVEGIKMILYLISR